MSWGIVCDNKERHFIESSHEPFCLTMVALEPDDKICDDEKVSLMLDIKGRQHLICTLIHGKLMQQPMKLKFAEGDEFEFYVQGNGKLHVLGHLETKFMDNTTMPFHNMTEVTDSDENEEIEDNKPGTKYLLGLDDSDDDNESDESWEPPVNNFDDLFAGNSCKDDKVSKSSSKKKVNFAKDLVHPDESYVLPPVKTNDLNVSSNEEDDDDESGMDEIESENNAQSGMDEIENDDESSDNDYDEAEKLVPIKRKRKETDVDSKRVKIMEPFEIKSIQDADKSKIFKKKKKQLEAEKLKQPNDDNDVLNSSIGRTPMPKKKLNMVYVKCPPASMPPPSSAPSVKGSNKNAMSFSKQLSGGVEYDDLKVGVGPLARKGKIVHVYYTGQLTDGTVFDKISAPKKAFAFRLGKGDVIKGWDIGVEGMKVGGKRRLKIPPAMAYGKTGQGPIPPNASLLFTVELKAING